MSIRVMNSARFTGRCALRTVQLSAAAAALACGQAMAAPQPIDAIGSGAISASSHGASLDRADALLAGNAAVAARRELETVDTSRLSGADADRYAQLSFDINTALSRATPADIAQQRAQLAAESRDVPAVERYAAAVLSDASATPQQRRDARSLMRQADDIRAAMQPRAEALVRTAIDATVRGDLAGAKLAFGELDRSGVELSAEQSELVSVHRGYIFEAEYAAGTASDATAGVFQPAGVIERDAGDDDASGTDAEQPADAAASSDDIIDRTFALRAQTLLTEADGAFERRELNTAIDKYTELLNDYRDYLLPADERRAVANLQESRAILRGNDDNLGQVITDINIARQAARAEYENYMAQAQDALTTGDMREARDFVAQARLTLNSNRNVLPQADFENWLGATESLVTEIIEAEEQQRESRRDELARSQEAEAGRIKEQQIRDRERRINEALDRVRTLQSELKYDEALQVVETVLFLDPNNPAGLLLKDVITDLSFYTRYDDIQRLKRQRLVENSLENQDAMVLPESIMTFPEDWPERSRRRSGPIGLTQSQDDKRVFAVLDRQRLPGVAFQQNSLAQVVDFMRDTTSLNIDVNWHSLGEIGVTRESAVDLRLRDVPVRTVLDRVMTNLSRPDSEVEWAVRSGVLTIGSREALARDTETIVYDIRDLLTSAPDFDNLPSFDLRDAMSEAGTDSDPFSAVTNSADPEVTVTKSRDDIADEARITQIIDIIQQNIAFESWTDHGGETGTIQELSGNLIVTNTPEAHQQIGGLLGQLREFRAMQINVEARFLLVDQNFFEQLGFDLDVYINSSNTQIDSANAIAGGNFAQGSDLFDVNTGAYTGVVNNPSTGLTFDPGRPSQFSPIGFGQNSLGLTNSLAGDSTFAGSVLSTAPALGIGGQFLDDVQVDFLVQATQADQRSVTLTAPRLTLTNGQTSSFSVATTSAFVSSLTPVTSTSSVGFAPTIGFQTTGVTLGVNGTVSADRRYVTMTVQTSISQQGQATTATATAVTGGTGGTVGGAGISSTLTLPTSTVTQVNTTVTVPDQGTMMLGGQRVITEVEVETGVPVVSKIPVLKRFFSNRIEAKEESTLLILVKPTILIQNEEEESNFPGLLDSLSSGGFGG